MHLVASIVKLCTSKQLVRKDFETFDPLLNINVDGFPQRPSGLDLTLFSMN